MTRAEIARRLGISKAYVTLLMKGLRQPSRKLQRKIDKLVRRGLLSDMFLEHGVQVVGGSNPLTPTIGVKLSGQTT